MQSIISIKSNGIECLKAMFAIAFITGRDESNKDSKSILCEKPEISAGLVDILSNILDCKGGIDYRLGTFSVRLVLQACLVLSISEDNKKVLVKTPLIQMLVRVLNLFISNSPPIPSCGGGGADTESAELAI